MPISDPIIYAISIIGGYLLGSISFGYIAAKAAGIDIRSVGSGNIGATNVLRTGRKDLAAITFIGDTGKGVATFFGTLFAACWPMGLMAAALWLLTAFIFRISSLGALVAAALVVPLAFFTHTAPYPFLGMALFMAVLIYIRHRDNIRRLLKGEEPKIGKKKE